MSVFARSLSQQQGRSKGSQATWFPVVRRKLSCSVQGGGSINRFTVGRRHTGSSGQVHNFLDNTDEAGVSFSPCTRGKSIYWIRFFDKRPRGELHMRLKLLLVVLLCLCAIPTYAQFKASIQGTIMDSGGAAIANARVQVVEQTTGLSRETVTSDQGFYRIAELPPGRYTVTVESTGFKSSVSKDVEVKAEEPRGLDVSLQVGAVSEQITVTAVNEGLQTEDASVSGTLTSRDVLTLPQFG